MRAAFIGMGLVAAGVFVLLLMPLVVFFGEILSNPEVFSWSWEARPSSEGVLLSINLTYAGSVPLKDFRFTIFFVDGEEYSVSSKELVRGDVLSDSVLLKIPVDTLSNMSFRMSFKIAGIYGFSLGVVNG